MMQLCKSNELISSFLLIICIPVSSLSPCNGEMGKEKIRRDDYGSNCAYLVQECKFLAWLMFEQRAAIASITLVFGSPSFARI